MRLTTIFFFIFILSSSGCLLNQGGGGGKSSSPNTNTDSETDSESDDDTDNDSDSGSQNQNDDSIQDNDETADDADDSIVVSGFDMTGVYDFSGVICTNNEISAITSVYDVVSGTSAMQITIDGNSFTEVISNTLGCSITTNGTSVFTLENDLGSGDHTGVFAFSGANKTVSTDSCYYKTELSKASGYNLTTTNIEGTLSSGAASDFNVEYLYTDDGTSISIWILSSLSVYGRSQDICFLIYSKQ